MRNAATIIFIVSLICSCNTHKSPEEIYTSGTVENWEDFDRVDINNSDHDSLVDVYVYKYDEKFLVMKMYTFTYSTGKKTFRNLVFSYQHKVEGRTLLYNPDGHALAEINFKNGEKDGRNISYNPETGKIIEKDSFSHGILIYKIRYDDQGNPTDTTFY